MKTHNFYSLVKVSPVIYDGVFSGGIGMSGYLRELERLHSVANGDDGVYDDTSKGDYVIIKSNGLLIGMPRAALDGFKKMKPIEKVSDDKKPDPYYAKHRKSRW